MTGRPGLSAHHECRTAASGRCRQVSTPRLRPLMDEQADGRSPLRNECPRWAAVDTRVGRGLICRFDRTGE